MSASGVSLAAAFGGGLASFTSPCVLPLVPAYLSLVGALDVTRQHSPPAGADVDTGGDAPGGDGIEHAGGVADAAGGGGVAVASRRAVARRRGAVTRDTVLFIAGFGVVFVLLGLSASALGRAVVHEQTILIRVSGVLVVAMAAFLVGSQYLRAPGVYGEWRLHPALSKLGVFAPPVAGAAFAFGWTPCVGPVLTSVLALSAAQGHVAQGALLLAVYSAGLGTPFLLVALFFDQVSRPLAWLRRHGQTVTLVSAAALAVMGILLITDRLSLVTTLVQRN